MVPGLFSESPLRAVLDAFAAGSHEHSLCPRLRLCPGRPAPSPAPPGPSQGGGRTNVVLPRSPKTAAAPRCFRIKGECRKRPPCARHALWAFWLSFCLDAQEPCWEQRCFLYGDNQGPRRCQTFLEALGPSCVSPGPFLGHGRAALIPRLPRLPLGILIRPPLP